MRRRTNPTRQALADAAERFVDERGLAALTMASFAKYAGVPTSSLCASVDGINGLMRDLAIRGFRGLADEVTHSALGYSGADAVARLMLAYRRYANEHPGLYLASMRRPDPEDAEWCKRSAQVKRVIHAAIAAYDLHGSARWHASRVIFSMLHGFVGSEMAGFFDSGQSDASVEDSFDWLVTAAQAALQAAAPWEAPASPQSVAEEVARN